MSKKPRSVTPHYSKETKREVLQLDLEGVTPFDISAKLNIPIPTLTKWIKDGDKILKTRTYNKKQAPSQEVVTENAPKCVVDKGAQIQSTNDLNEEIDSKEIYKMFKPLVDKGLLGDTNEQDLQLAIAKIHHEDFQGYDFYDILDLVTIDRIQSKGELQRGEYIRKLENIRKKYKPERTKRSTAKQTDQELDRIKSSFAHARRKAEQLEEPESEHAKLIAKQTMELLQESDDSDGSVSMESRIPIEQFIKTEKPQVKASINKVRNTKRNVKNVDCDLPQIQVDVKPKRKYTRKPKPGATEIIEPPPKDIDRGLCDIPEIQPPTKAKRKYTRKPKTVSVENTGSMNTVQPSISFEKPQIDIDSALCDIPVIKRVVKPKTKCSKKTPSIVLDSDDSERSSTMETPTPVIEPAVAVKLKRKYRKKTFSTVEPDIPILQPIDEGHLCPATEKAFQYERDPSKEVYSESDLPEIRNTVAIMPECSPIKDDEDQKTVCKPPSTYEKINEMIDGFLDEVKDTFSSLTGKTNVKCPQSRSSEKENDAHSQFKKPNTLKCKKPDIKPETSPLKPSNVVIRDVNVKPVGGEIFDRCKEQLNVPTKLQEECPNEPNEPVENVPMEECPSHVAPRKPPLTGPIILTAIEKERRMVLYRRILHEMISDDEEDDEFSDTEKGKSENCPKTFDTVNVNDECISCTLTTQADQNVKINDDIEEQKGGPASCDYGNQPRDTCRLESDSESEREYTCQRDVEMQEISDSLNLDIEQIAEDLSLSETTNQLNTIESSRIDVDIEPEDVVGNVCEHVKDNMENIEQETTTDFNDECGLINEKEFQMFENAPVEEKYAQLGLNISDSDQSKSSALSVGCGVNDRETVERNTVSACENQKTNEFLLSQPNVTRKDCDLDIGSSRESKKSESSIASSSESLLSELNVNKIDISQLENDLYLTSEEESESSDTDKNCNYVSKNLSKSQRAKIEAEEFKKKHSSNLNDEDLMFYSNIDFTEEDDGTSCIASGGEHKCNFCIKKVVDKLKPSNEKQGVAGPANININELKDDSESSSSSSDSSSSDSSSSESSTCTL